MSGADVAAAGLASRRQGQVRWIHAAKHGPDADIGTPTDRIRALLLAADLLDVADLLVEIDRERARFILGTSLRYELAYQAEVMDEAAATSVIDRFEALFGDSETQFLTNRLEEDGLTEDDPPLGYDRVPSSGGTFDSLVCGLSSTDAALVCVIDED